MITDKPLQDLETYYLMPSPCFNPINFAQYMDKIRHLKRKYVKKRKTFVKAHDLKCVYLSKFIWGDDEVNSDVKCNERSKKIERKKKKKQDLSSLPNSSKVVKHRGEENSNVKEDYVKNSDWFENSFLVGLVESLGVDSVKKRWSLVPIESKKKLEEQLKLLQGKELECKKIEEMLKGKEVECVRQRSDLLNEVISVITKSN